MTTTSGIPNPNSTSSLLLSLQALVTALEIQVSAAQRASTFVHSSSNVSLSESAQTAAQTDYNAKLGAAVSRLLKVKQAAVGNALNGSQLVLSAMDATMSALSNQETTLYDTAKQLSDLVASMETITQRAVYDTMIIEEATGQYEYVWMNCNGKAYSKPVATSAWSFNVTTFGNIGGASSGIRRSMLVRSFSPVASRNTGSQSGSPSGIGYLPVASEHVHEDEFLTGPGANASAMLDRRLFRSLHLIGGVMLHGVRRSMDEHGLCKDDRGDFRNLNFDCVRHAVKQDFAFSNTISSFLGSLFGTETNSLHPYGTDPVFLPRSSLYDARLADKVNQYYNTTHGSGEVSATGAPYSYFPKRLQGYPTGFPVMLSNQLTERRLWQMITYLKDSNFLDRYTRRLTAEVLALSTELRVFGHMAMTFTWARDGLGALR
ncbi:hypothetical protein PLESTF_000241800 [Pleodorina starrii]|nr:hypothetical protein PLESTF_000241800 [Pleodorina starrii]